MTALKFRTVLGLLIFTVVGRADPFDTWTQRNASAAGNRLDSIAYGNGLFVVVGEKSNSPYSPVILTSGDGVSWDRGQLLKGLPTEWAAIAYGNGKFVVAMEIGFADFSTILTSGDGVNWVERASATRDIDFAIAYGNGQFVVVGSGIQTSTEGINWTQRQSGITNGLLQAITYGNGQFVAVGVGNIVTSSDAVNWVVQQESSPSDRIDLNDIGLHGIAYGVGQFVVVGYRSSDPAYPSAILTSTDGTNWVHRQSGATNSILEGIAYGNGQFVAVGSTGTIVTSPDGIIWTSRTSGTGNDLYAVAYGNGHFVAAGSNGTILESGPIINLSVMPMARAKLLSLSLEGPTGLDYTIQTSTDLVSWREVSKVTKSQSTRIILDGLPVASGRVFYRAYSQ